MNVSTMEAMRPMNRMAMDNPWHGHKPGYDDEDHDQNGHDCQVEDRGGQEEKDHLGAGGHGVSFLGREGMRKDTKSRMPETTTVASARLNVGHRSSPKIP